MRTTSLPVIETDFFSPLETLSPVAKSETATPIKADDEAMMYEVFICL